MSAAPLRAEPPRDRYTYDHLRLDPVTPTIGAEIGGIDLRQPVSPGQAADIRRALNEWRVVFFRDQAIDSDQLKAFGRTFGPLTPAHPIAAGLPDHPEVWERRVEEYRTRRQRNDTLPPGREPPRDHKGWHIDITFVANPNSYSLLHGLTIPPYGGDTLFTNLIAAYEGLSAPVRTLVDGLQAVHRTSGGDFAGARHEARGTAYVSLHPLVRVHPETGERLLFLNPGTISHIVGLNARESQALLDLLFYEATRPEYQVRFRWQPQSLVVWDNQAVAHAGPIDYAQFDLPRAVRRITVAGDLPEGPDGFRSRPLEGELFPVLG